MERLCDHLVVCRYSSWNFLRNIEIITFISMKIHKKKIIFRKVRLFEHSQVFIMFESSRWDLKVSNENHCDVNQHA